MKIYFAGSIRGGRNDREIYQALIEYLRSFGEVLTEHVADAQVSEQGERNIPDAEIFQKDMRWLAEADRVVAEVSAPSLGVGYEIGRAEAMGKKILCLFNPSCGRVLSAMLSGNPSLTVQNYSDLQEAESLISAFLTQGRMTP